MARAVYPFGAVPSEMISHLREVQKLREKIFKENHPDEVLPYELLKAKCFTLKCLNNFIVRERKIYPKKIPAFLYSFNDNYDDLLKHANDKIKEILEKSNEAGESSEDKYERRLLLFKKGSKIIYGDEVLLEKEDLDSEQDIVDVCEKLYDELLTCEEEEMIESFDKLTVTPRNINKSCSEVVPNQNIEFIVIDLRDFYAIENTSSETGEIHGQEVLGGNDPEAEGVNDIGGKAENDLSDSYSSNPNSELKISEDVTKNVDRLNESLANGDRLEDIDESEFRPGPIFRTSSVEVISRWSSTSTIPNIPQEKLTEKELNHESEVVDQGQYNTLASSLDTPSSDNNDSDLILNANDPFKPLTIEIPQPSILLDDIYDRSFTLKNDIAINENYCCPRKELPQGLLMIKENSRSSFSSSGDDSVNLNDNSWPYMSGSADGYFEERPSQKSITLNSKSSSPHKLSVDKNKKEITKVGLSKSQCSPSIDDDGILSAMESTEPELIDILNEEKVSKQLDPIKEASSYTSSLCSFPERGSEKSSSNNDVYGDTSSSSIMCLSKDTSESDPSLLNSTYSDKSLLPQKNFVSLDKNEKFSKGKPSCSARKSAIVSKSTESVGKMPTLLKKAVKHKRAIAIANVLKTKKGEYVNTSIKKPSKFSFRKQRNQNNKAPLRRSARLKSCVQKSTCVAMSLRRSRHVTAFKPKKSKPRGKKEAVKRKLKMPKKIIPPVKNIEASAYTNMEIVCVHVHIDELNIDELSKTSPNDQEDKYDPPPKRAKSERIAAYLQKNSKDKNLNK